MASQEQHQELLQKYAEAIVKVGLNLREGQRLIITNSTSRGVAPAGRELVHVDAEDELGFRPVVDLLARLGRAVVP